MDSEPPSDAPQSPALALPRALRELMGLLALVMAVLALIAAVFGVSYFGSQLSSGILGHCWALQDINGKTYKVDTCTGRTILLKHASGEKS